MDARSDPPADRYREIDLLRSVAIVCMVIYHAAFDLAFFYALPLSPTAGGWLLLQRSTAILFLGLVGVSFAVSYGRMERRGTGWRSILAKSAKRAAGLLICAALISGVTMVTAGDQWIRFGALHLIGSSLLLLPFLMPLREGTAFLALGILLATPFVRSLSTDSCFLLPLGVPPRVFASLDYLPFIPWLTPVLFGTAVGNMFYNRRWLRSHLPKNRLTALLALPGRHALLLYFVHQPLLLALLWTLLGKPNFHS
ncbi:MAG: heparan-alpha-glucosaminide N-acetyltransferase [Candidatus Peribacter sp.]|nr:heparan-alpha-glucosaminide N-acetyltransferase [Candidatus Peribacter sp.]